MRLARSTRRRRRSDCNIMAARGEAVIYIYIYIGWQGNFDSPIYDTLYIYIYIYIYIHTHILCMCVCVYVPIIRYGNVNFDIF